MLMLKSILIISFILTIRCQSNIVNSIQYYDKLDENNNTLYDQLWSRSKLS